MICSKAPTINKSFVIDILSGLATIQKAPLRTKK